MRHCQQSPQGVILTRSLRQCQLTNFSFSAAPATQAPYPDQGAGRPRRQGKPSAKMAAMQAMAGPKDNNGATATAESVRGAASGRGRGRGKGKGRADAT